MKHTFLIAACALAAVLLLAACGGASKTSAPSQTKQATRTHTATATEATTSQATTTKPPRRTLHVERVIDGDTIELENGDRIRLVQIDAPEASGECYGQKAGTVLRRLLPVGATVRAVRDPRLDNVDGYGRKLRYIFKGKQNINLVLVMQGAASVWFFDGDRGRYADQLLEAATSAEKAGRGAWGACTAVLDPTSAFTTHPKHKAHIVVGGEGGGSSDNCDPNYKGACLHDGIGDYDCAGGSGDGPNYISGPIQVVGSDPFRLDGDGDGTACE